MEPHDSDIGVILVVLDRFERQRLPWLSDMQQKMDHGEPLNEFDIEYLSEALEDIRYFIPYMERNPEYKPLFARVIHYYKLITDRALTVE